MYSRDARLPTETFVTHVRNPYLVDVDDYKEDLLSNLSLAWQLAAENPKIAEVPGTLLQPFYYEVELKAGDRVIVHMPLKLQGEQHKLKSHSMDPTKF